MKSSLVSIPALCLILIGCQPAEQEQNDTTTEERAPSLESESPDATTDMPATPDEQAPAGSDSQAPAGEDMAVEYAEAEILSTEGQDTGGLVKITRSNGQVTIQGTITGLEPGAHGFHIHEKGDCSAPDASSAGGHFEPADDPHGAPEDPPAEHHLGDFGNITAGENGEAEVNITDSELQMSGPDSIIGKAVIVHAGRDDLQSQPSGDAGARVGCGVIHALEVAESSTTV